MPPGGDLLHRVARVLLADERVVSLGVPRPSSSEPRTSPLAGFTADVVIAVGNDHPYVRAAVDSGTPVVTPDGEAQAVRGDLKVMAYALADRLPNDEATLAWTVRGDTLGDGETVQFPEPLGRQHGRSNNGGVEVPVEGRWGGVLVRTPSQSMAVVDDGRFLLAISLAARALSLVNGETKPGSVYLDELRRGGVEFASARR